MSSKFETMKAHAQELADTPIQLTPEREALLQAKLGRSQESVRELARYQQNRLKLIVYKTTIDPEGSPIFSEWISNNVRATQILINAIRPGSLVEDGVLGPETQKYVKNLFDIEVDIIPSSASTSTSTTTPEVLVAEAETPSFRTSADGTVSFEIPDFIKDEEQIRCILETLEITGLEIKNGKLVGVNELETTEKLKKLKKYLDYTNYLYQENRTPEKMMQHYRELLSYETNFIQDKKYLIMQYASAIYEDIIQAGHIVQQDPDGKYYIRDASGERVTNSPYNDFVHGYVDGRTEYIEFARLNAIVGHNSMMWAERMVTRTDLVTSILQNNNIVSSALSEIGAMRNTQSIETLLLYKDEALAALRAKVNTSDYSHQQQELLWLIDFLAHEHYKHDEAQRTLYNNINHYNKVFQAEQSFIDAMTAQGIDPESADFSEPSTIEKIENVFKKNKFALIGVGLLMMLFSATRGLGSKVLLGTVAGGIALSVAADSADQFSGKKDAGKVGNDAFDLFDPVKIRHRIKYPQGFDRAHYDGTLTKFYEANDARIDNGGMENGSAQTLTNNARIAKIFQTIMASDELLNINYATSDKQTLITQILGKMGDPATVSNGDLDSVIPKEQEGAITSEDIKAFLEIMDQMQGENDTISIHDILFGGESLVSQEYENKTFTGDSFFDSSINTLLQQEWTPTQSSNDPLNISDTMKMRSEILELQTILKQSISSGNFDGLFDSATSWDITIIHRDFASQISIIDTLIANISANPHISENLKNSLTQSPNNENENTGILRKVQVFILGKSELAKLADGEGMIQAAITTAQNLINPSEDELREQIETLNTLRDKLNPAAFSINGTVVNLSEDPIYTNLSNAIDKEREYVENSITELENTLLEELTEKEEKIRVKANQLRNTIANFEASNDPKKKIEYIAKGLEANYADLKEAWDEVQATDTSVDSPETRIKGMLEDLFGDRGSIAAIKEEVQNSFNAYFEANQEIINTELVAIDASFTDVSAAISALKDLSNIEGRFTTIGEIGSYDRFLNWIQNSPNAQSKTEQYYEQLKQSPYAGMAVADESNTLRRVAEAVIEKRKRIAENIFDYVNALNLSSIQADDFDKLYEIQDLGMVELVDSQQPGTNFKEVFGRKFSQATVKYLQSIPSSVDGIDKLREFESSYINPNPNLITRIMELWQSDAITPAFSREVGRVTSDILRDDFSEDMTGLEAILNFKTDRAQMYRWISEKDDTFEDRYNIRINEIRNNILNNSLVVENSTILGFIQAEANTLQALNTEESNAALNVLLALINENNEQNLFNLITKLNLTDSTPDGDYNNIPEILRTKIHRELKNLKLI